MSRKTTFPAAVILGSLMWSGMAMAQSHTDNLVNSLKADGYTAIEVQNGRTQSKVEAIRGDRKTEMVIDRATGQIMKSETEMASRVEQQRSGVSVRDRSDRDFVGDDGRMSSRSDDGRGRKGHSSDDDDREDDSRDDNNHNDDSHDRDDDHGNHHGDDHDKGDDHGSDHDGDGHDSDHDGHGGDHGGDSDGHDGDHGGDSDGHDGDHD